MVTRRTLLILTTVYVAAHGWIFLLGDALFWDDWTLVDVTRQVVIEDFTQLGAPWTGYVHALVLAHPIGPWLYRALTFFFHLSAGLFLYGLLSTFRGLRETDRALIAIFYLVFPFFWSRIALIVLPYSTGIFLFFGAWFLWVCGANRKGGYLRLLSLGAFVMSFCVLPSLLMFYALPVVHRWHIFNRDGNGGLLVFLKRSIGFLLAPEVFWFLRHWWFPAHGAYEGYNDPTLDKDYLWYLWYTPRYMVHEFLHLKIRIELLVLCLPLAWIVAYLLDQRKRIVASEPEKDYRAGVTMLLLGVVALYLGVEPYLLVGKIPWHGDWASRYQALMPLGTAVLIVSGYKMFDHVSRRIWVAFWLSLCLALDMSYYVWSLRDWIKQEALIAAFRRESDIARGTTFPIVDRTRGYNVEFRGYREYEWRGLLRRAFDGDERRYADDMDVGSIEEWQERANLQRGMQTPVAMPDCMIVVEKGDVELAGWTFVDVVIARIVDKERYRTELLPRVLIVRCGGIEEKAIAFGS